MNDARKTPGWLIVALALSLGTAGCSLDSAASGDESSSETGGFDGGTDESGESSDSASEDTGDSSESDESTDAGTEDTNSEDEGPIDAGSSAQACDPGFGQELDLDLGEVNSEVAPALVREWVLAGEQGVGLVPKIPLSPQPFLNHVEFGYGSALELPDVVGELWRPADPNPNANAGGPERYRLQYAVRGPALSPQQRPPVDLSIVVDMGPDMEAGGLALAEEALLALESSLRVGDRVSLIAALEEPLVIYEGLALDSDAVLELYPLSGVLEGVGGESFADVPKALETAYDLLQDEGEGAAQGRVLLLSGGHFTAPPELLDWIDAEAVDGRYLISFGLGAPGLYVEAGMRRLARVGRGSALFARDPEIVWQELYNGFTDHVVAMGADVEMRLILPPGLAVSERDPTFGGDTVDGPHQATLGPNSSLVFHHHLERCGELDPEAVIRVELDWRQIKADQGQLLVWELPVSELSEGSEGSPEIRKGAAVLAYTAAIVAYRDADDGVVENYGAVLDALALIGEALEYAPGDQDLSQMSEVLGKIDQG